MSENSTVPSRSGLIRGSMRRTIYMLLVALTTLFAMNLLYVAYASGGLTPLKILLLFLYAILILWIATSFWSASAGLLAAVYALRLLRQAAQRCGKGCDTAACYCPYCHSDAFVQ